MSTPPPSSRHNTPLHVAAQVGRAVSPIKREHSVVHSSAVTPLIGRGDVKEMERDVTLRLGRLQSDLLTLKQHRGYLSVAEQKLVSDRAKAMQLHAKQLEQTIAELEQLSFEFAPSSLSAGATAIPELQRHAFDLADRQVRLRAHAYACVWEWLRGCVAARSLTRLLRPACHVHRSPS